MKILILYTHNRSMLSFFFQELSGKFSADGYEVFNFYLKHKSESFNENGVQVQGEKRGNHFQNYYKIFKVIKRTKPDVVISNFSYVNPALLFGRFLGVTHNVIWFHTLIKQMNFKPSKIFVKSKFMNLASIIITNSKELKNEVISEYSQKPEKVYNLPFTTSIAVTDIKRINFDKLEGKTYIGCPGRIHPDKNQNLIIDALFELNNENLILVLAGSTDHDFLEHHKNYHNYKNKIIYLGNLSREEMVDFYSQMDIIVLPSLNEAFGLVFIEALASGCQTLVSSRFGALDYIKEDVASITFNPHEVEDLKNKLMEILINKKSSQYFKSLYENNFSLDLIANKVMNLIGK